MHTKVKICGITRLADARYCAGAGADFLGFIQHPESPRYVAPETAKEIIAWLHGPEPVGVFVDAGADHVNRVADETGFTLVQLHGGEPPEVCAAVERPVIKALAVGADATPETLAAAMDRYAPHVAYFLLDTADAALHGGTGRTFDWNKARALAETYPVFLAGGLGPENVAEAVQQVRPFAVDASSRLEAEPGVKDLDRLADFFDAVAGVEVAG